ncbi:hypothetical protein EJ02DRAFT_433060 [Clathrospora elynae]|uniref:Uncharacterized protein n=1 Tax=Clathrospora elynae TaxID=706981 RepID=A0A6A5SST5_9PLEO|nr:hypothetical protein EJ02DRAFT_433060 [Clathrospora elynae]
MGAPQQLSATTSASTGAGLMQPLITTNSTMMTSASMQPGHAYSGPRWLDNILWEVNTLTFDDWELSGPPSPTIGLQDPRPTTGVQEAYDLFLSHPGAQHVTKNIPAITLALDIPKSEDACEAVLRCVAAIAARLPKKPIKILDYRWSLYGFGVANIANIFEDVADAAGLDVVGRNWRVWPRLEDGDREWLAGHQAQWEKEFKKPWMLALV